jgi:hypothetical protein
VPFRDPFRDPPGADGVAMGHPPHFAPELIWGGAAGPGMA